MPQTLGQPGTSDPIEKEYLKWESADGTLRVRIQGRVVEAIARLAIERSEGLPVEIGGLLLGHAAGGEKPAVWIDRFEAVECEHRSGPHFALSAEEQTALESRTIRLAGELTVVGFCRSHLRPGFEPDEEDHALAARFFPDAEDLALLIAPTPGSLRGRFFRRDNDGALRFAEPEFAFQARPAGERLGRLVADFLPARENFPLRELPAAAPATAELTRPRRRSSYWLVGAALIGLAVGGAALVRQAVHSPEGAAGETAEVRPLGLYVDPAASGWRISWNPSASALRGARSVRLFVREAGNDEQSAIDLTAGDLKSGNYRFQSKGLDVTFRLEATGADGRISAESFRVLKSVAAAPAAVAEPEVTRPRAIHKVPPVVPASIRPRIRAPIPVDVRVRVDAQGRVVSAVPVAKPHSGLEAFVTARAVAAAKQWRFEPARENGKAVAGSETIHFSFEK